MTAFTLDRMQHCVVSFGCKTTPVRELKASQAKAIAARLTEVWSDLFEDELSEEQMSQVEKQGALYARRKTIFLPQGSAEIPSLVITPNTITISVARKLMSQNVPIEPDNFWIQGEVNAKARRAVLELQSILNIAVHRAGKMYELHFPVTPDELREFFGFFFSNSPDQIGGFRGQVNYLKDQGRTYNLNLNVVADPAQVDQPTSVAVKVDINNRDMASALEPSTISEVWAFADSMMPDWMLRTLGGDPS